MHVRRLWSHTVPCGQVLAVGPVTEQWKNWRESVGCAMYSTSAPGREHQTSNPSAYLQRGRWQSSPAVTAAAMRAARSRGRTLCTAMVRTLCNEGGVGRVLYLRASVVTVCWFFFTTEISSYKETSGNHSHYKACAHDNVRIFFKERRLDSSKCWIEKQLELRTIRKAGDRVTPFSVGYLHFCLFQGLY